MSSATRDVENGLYPQLQQRPQTRRQDTVDMEVIPLQDIHQQPQSAENDERQKIRHIFDRVCIDKFHSVL